MNNENKLTDRDFYALVNNVLMKGTFTGDAIHEASSLMKFCSEMVRFLDTVDGKQENK